MIYPQNFEQKIGFDEIRTILGGHCLSPLGRERVEQMRFLTDIAPLRELQEHTREFLRIMDSGQDFPEQDFYDVRPAIRRIRIEGTYLDETELFDLKRSLTTIIDIISFLDKEKDEEEADEKEAESEDKEVVEAEASEEAAPVKEVPHKTTRRAKKEEKVEEAAAEAPAEKTEA